jgi:hypothetical protein
LQIFENNDVFINHFVFRVLSFGFANSKPQTRHSKLVNGDQKIAELP